MKTRGMTPKFMQQSIAAAQGINPNYKPADEVITFSLTSMQFVMGFLQFRRERFKVTAFNKIFQIRDI